MHTWYACPDRVHLFLIDKGMYDLYLKEVKLSNPLTIPLGVTTFGHFKPVGAKDWKSNPNAHTQWDLLWSQYDKLSLQFHRREDKNGAVHFTLF